MLTRVSLALVLSGLSLAALGTVAAFTFTSTVANSETRLAQAPAPATPPAPERKAEPGQEPAGGIGGGKPVNPVEKRAPSGAQQEQPAPEPHKRGDVRITAPGTDVRIDGERGVVRVEAPYTSVAVDPNHGSVRVDAPWFKLDLHW